VASSKLSLIREQSRQPARCKNGRKSKKKRIARSLGYEYAAFDQIGDNTPRMSRREAEQPGDIAPRQLAAIEDRFKQRSSLGGVAG
jgi:hypothetical protein